MNAESLAPAAAGALPVAPKLIRLDRVQEITQLSKSTIYKLVREENFPEPVRLTKRAVAWFEDEVWHWLEERRKDRRLPGDKPH